MVLRTNYNQKRKIFIECFFLLFCLKKLIFFIYHLILFNFVYIWQTLLPRSFLVWIMTSEILKILKLLRKSLNFLLPKDTVPL